MANLDGLKKTKRTGVYYREHETRMLGESKRRDRCFILRYTIGGKTRTEVFGWESAGRTELLAEQKIAEFKANHKVGITPVCMADEHATICENRKDQEAARKAAEEAELNKPTLNRLWEKYNDAVTTKSRRTDKSFFLTYLAPTFGAKTPDEIAPLDVDRLRVNMEKGKIGPSKRPLAAQTIKHVLALLRRLVFFGVEKKLCKPLDFKIKMPNVDNAKTEHLTDEQVARLVAALDAEPDKVAVAAVKLAMLTGMRKGEILKLQWRNVDLDRQFVRIDKPKGSKSVTLPISAEAVETLRTLPKVSEWCFPGRKTHLVDLKKPIDRIRKAAGLPADFRPMHGQRHHYASTLAESGVDLFTISKLLNHAKPEMSARYAHLRDESLRTAAGKAAAAYDTASNGDNEK